MGERRKTQNSIYLIYTVLFAGIWCVIALPFFLRGNGLIGEADSFNQSFPVYIYIGDYIRELLRGNFIQFDFRLGLGDDVFAALNWHGFGDVLQITAALVPARYAEPAYTVTMLLKYYLCGLAFLIYIRKYAEQSLFRVAGALLYAFCIFGLIWGLNCWMFLNPMFTLPLILHGIDEILENKDRLSKWLMIGLFVQSMNGFYFLYMEIIITIIYFLVVTVIRKKKSIFAYGLSVMLQGVLGVSLGGVFLLPSIIGFFNSSRTDQRQIFDSFWQLFFYEDYHYYLTSLSHMLIPDAYGSIITIPIVMLAGVILYFTGSRSHGEFKFLFGGLGIMFFLPVMGSIMNGFSYSVDRWYFAVLLFGITGTVLAMQTEKEFSLRNRYLFWGIAFLTILINVARSEWNPGILIRTAIFAVLIGLLPFIWNRKEKREIWLLAYVTITIIINGLFLFGPKVLGGSGYSAGFKPYDAACSEMAESMDGIEKEEDFNRMDIYDSSLSSSLVMDYYGTTEYFSTLNGRVSEFYRELFISPGVRSATWILKGLDGRRELESLLSVSQYMDFKADENGQRTAAILKNDDSLPFGFTYDRWISRERFDQLNPMEKQSIMLECAVLETPSETIAEKKDIARNADQQVACRLEWIDIDRRLRIWLEDFEEKSGELYIKLSDFVLNNEGVQDLAVGNKSLQIRNRDDDYYMGSDEFWVNVSEIKQADNKYYFDIFSLGEKKYSLGKVQVFQHTINKQGLMDRSQNELTDLKVENNKICGKINVEKPELLFLSIPYSKGWSATMDGQEVEIIKANIAFASIELKPGMHEICFTYNSPGLKAGIGLSVISLAVLLVWRWQEIRRRRREPA